LGVVTATGESGPCPPIVNNGSTVVIDNAAITLNF
jgi:hypothetical protein